MIEASSFLRGLDCPCLDFVMSVHDFDRRVYELMTHDEIFLRCETRVGSQNIDACVRIDIVNGKVWDQMLRPSCCKSACVVGEYFTMTNELYGDGGGGRRELPRAERGSSRMAAAEGLDYRVFRENRTGEGAEIH